MNFDKSDLEQLKFQMGFALSDGNQIDVYYARIVLSLIEQLETLMNKQTEVHVNWDVEK